MQAKLKWIVNAALVSSALAVSACGNGDDSSTPAPVADGGAAVDATSHDAMADAATDSSATDAGPSPTALFVGSDLVTNAELSAIALQPDASAGHLALADQDSVAYASGGTGFVLEHALGAAIVLDPSDLSKAARTIDLNDGPDAGAYASNPRALLVTTGTKAYAARYASNVVPIVDIATGAVTTGIDLSSFVATDDTDGLVDVQDAVYDPTTGRAYFLLERINQNDFSGAAPDYVGACLVSHGEIVGVNAIDNTILDLNGSAPGQAIDLLGANPQSLTADFAHGQILVANAGCYQLLDGSADVSAATRVGRGVESVAVATGVSTWLFQTTDVDRLSALLWVDATHAFVNLGDDWFAWNPTTPTLGALATGFPQAPLYDGAGHVFGLSPALPDAGIRRIGHVVGRQVGRRDVAGLEVRRGPVRERGPGDGVRRHRRAPSLTSATSATRGSRRSSGRPVHRASNGLRRLEHRQARVTEEVVVDRDDSLGPGARSKTFEPRVLADPLAHPGVGHDDVGVEDEELLDRVLGPVAVARGRGVGETRGDEDVAVAAPDGPAEEVPAVDADVEPAFARRRRDVARDSADRRHERLDQPLASLGMADERRHVADVRYQRLEAPHRAEVEDDQAGVAQARERPGIADGVGDDEVRPQRDELLEIGRTFDRDLAVEAEAPSRAVTGDRDDAVRLAQREQEIVGDAAHRCDAGERRRRHAYAAAVDPRRSRVRVARLARLLRGVCARARCRARGGPHRESQRRRQRAEVREIGPRHGRPPGSVRSGSFARRNPSAAPGTMRTP